MMWGSGRGHFGQRGGFVERGLGLGVARGGRSFGGGAAAAGVAVAGGGDFAQVAAIAQDVGKSGADLDGQLGGGVTGRRDLDRGRAGRRGVGVGRRRENYDLNVARRDPIRRGCGPRREAVPVVRAGSVHRADFGQQGGVGAAAQVEAV